MSDSARSAGVDRTPTLSAAVMKVVEACLPPTASTLLGTAVLPVAFTRGRWTRRTWCKGAAGLAGGTTSRTRYSSRTSIGREILNAGDDLEARGRARSVGRGCSGRACWCTLVEYPTAHWWSTGG